MAEEHTATWIVHVTDGGAVYISDNHDFGKATFAIRMDGEREKAEQIVREHNSHAALVATLRAIDNDENTVMRAALVFEMRDALKLAEGTTEPDEPYGHCDTCGAICVEINGRATCPSDSTHKTAIW